MRPSEILKTKREGVHRIFMKYEEFGIVEPKIFGSVARGTDTETSDIDFLVTIDETKDKKKSFSYFVLGRLLVELNEFLGIECDIIMKHCLKKSYKKILTESREF